MEKEPKYNVEALYLGERWTPHQGFFKLFRDAKGEQLRFAGKIKWIYPGSSYYVTKDGSIKLRPDEVPEEKRKLKWTEAEELEYEAQKEIIKHQRELNKKAMELKKPHPDIVRAIALLRPFTRGMDLVTLRRFTGYLENQLSKKKK